MIARLGERWLRAALLAAALALLLVPIAWTALASLGVQPDTTTSPPSWSAPTLANFADVGVAEPGFMDELTTSAIASAGATALAVTVAFLAAYGLARGTFQAARFVPWLLVLASVPVAAYVLPPSELARGTHLDDSLPGVVLAQAAITAPLAAFVLFGSLSRMPTDTEDAARIDGAGVLGTLARVTVPALWPSIAATAVVVFVLAWNSLLVPLLLTDGHVKMIPVAMSDFFTFERELEWPTAAAALIVSFLPLAALVMASQSVLDRFTLHERSRT